MCVRWVAPPPPPPPSLAVTPWGFGGARPRPPRSTVGLSCCSADDRRPWMTPGDGRLLRRPATLAARVRALPSTPRLDGPFRTQTNNTRKEFKCGRT